MSGSGDTQEAETGAWFVYVLLSHAGDRTYVGITLDCERRLEQHNGEVPGGAKTTRAGRPWSVGRTLGPFADRGTAQVVEAVLKRYTGRDRLSVEVPLP